tara:strand:+ start:129 stop:650 length:522 start_codon:yes stop_codon:yes gene_type:complete
MTTVLHADIHKHEWLLSIGLSNFEHNMWNNNNLEGNEFKEFISLRFSRIDLKNIRSGFGIAYLKDISHPLSSGSGNYMRHKNYIHHKILFNMNLTSFLDKTIITRSVFKLRTGFKSYFNLGSPHNSVALGPTLGISIKGVFLEYFRGYMDLIDFSLYTDKISLGISIKGKNND